MKPSRWTSQAFAGALALAGAAAVVGGVALGFRAVFDPAGDGLVEAFGLVALGAVVQVAAVGLSVVGARARESRRPVVALVYGALALGVAGLYGLAQVQERAYYRANPGVAGIDPTEDGTGVEVESVAGRRTVRYDRCPGGDPGALSTGFKTGDGYVDVSRGSGRAYIRIYTARAVEECLVGGAPAGGPLRGSPFRDGLP